MNTTHEEQRGANLEIPLFELEQRFEKLEGEFNHMKLQQMENLAENISKKFNDHPTIYIPKLHLHMHMMKEFREKTELFISRTQRKEDDEEAKQFSGRDL